MLSFANFTVSAGGEIWVLSLAEYGRINLMKFSPVWPGVISEWLINLSAGWVGAAVIIPTAVPLKSPTDAVFLTVDILLGIVALLIAKELRERRKSLWSAILIFTKSSTAPACCLLYCWLWFCWCILLSGKPLYPPVVGAALDNLIMNSGLSSADLPYLVFYTGIGVFLLFVFLMVYTGRREGYLIWR